MLVAQALGEYTAALVLSGAIDQFVRLVDRVQNFEPSTWALVGAAALGVWFFVGRTR